MAQSVRVKAGTGKREPGFVTIDNTLGKAQGADFYHDAVAIEQLLDSMLPSGTYRELYEAMKRRAEDVEWIEV